MEDKEKQHPLKGRKLTEEHKRRISEGKKGSTYSEEFKEKLSKATQGPKNPNAKLSYAQCLEIRMKFDNRGGAGITETLKRLAYEYNVSQLTIRKIKDGSHWSMKKFYKDKDDVN